MNDLILHKQSTRYPDLTVHKYHRKVFYKNLWHTDPQLLESRGHVYDSTGKLVVNPPTKVFNYQENGTTIDLDEECLVVGKINGFMACLTYNSDLDKVLVSTTGSLDSKYCDMARDYLAYAINFIETRRLRNTFFFEICHHDDPHIIPENTGAYLLGSRALLDTNPYTSWKDKEEYFDWFAKLMRVARPAYTTMQFKDILNHTKICQHEGYMVYGLESGTVLKLKSPYYLTLKVMARSKDLLSLSRERIDEEFYPLLDHLLELGSEFSSLPEQEKLTYIRAYYNN